MPLTGLTMARLKEHIRKYSPAYIVGIIIVLLFSNIIWTTTAPRVPEEYEVLIYLVDTLPYGEKLEPLAEEALPEVQKFDPELQSIVPTNIMFNDPTTDYNSSMLLMARMAVGDGDVYLASSLAIESLTNSGLCLPLDEYLEAGWMEGLDLEPYSYTDIETGETYTAALSLDNVDALAELGAMNNEGAYLLVAVNGTNQETSMETIEYMIRRLMEDDYVSTATEESAG